MKKLSRRSKFSLITGVILLIILLYYSSGYFFVFNNDAYVDADWVKVSTAVSGPIDQIQVKDNQLVKKNTLMLSLLSTPFEIALNKAQANLDQATATQALLTEQIKEASDFLKGEQAKQQLAEDDYQRYSKLAQTGAVSKDQLDKKTAAYQVAVEQVENATQKLLETRKQHAVAKANIQAAKAALALAQYDLEQSVIKAPAKGIVNNLRVYKGDYARAGEPLFGFIKTNTWRVVANIKESNLVGVKPGKQVWLYLSSHPWQLFKGKVESIGRGIARNPNEQNASMPYIQPITDWIRYDYRLPVRICFENLDQIKDSLHVGSDVKVFIF